MTQQKPIRSEVLFSATTVKYYAILKH